MFQNNHPDIAESAVVGCPHDLKGEGIFAFLSLKEHVTEPEDKIISKLKILVREEIAAFAIPDYFLVSFIKL